ncbi:hypothetical protein QK291_05970 [Arthrobacter sp. AL12]|nr:hypothetical protein [Arthrobacter sp. AL12]MDI3211606.1 hypothetical protein [Arthrobacter sp. AL12]
MFSGSITLVPPSAHGLAVDIIDVVDEQVEPLASRSADQTRSLILGIIAHDHEHSAAEADFCVEDLTRCPILAADHVETDPLHPFQGSWGIG